MVKVEDYAKDKLYYKIQHLVEVYKKPLFSKPTLMYSKWIDGTSSLWLSEYGRQSYGNNSYKTKKAKRMVLN